MGESSLNPDSSEAAVYVMSVAAELVGTHPQTLRDYERRGLVSPQRSTGGNRRYTHSDIKKVLRIKSLKDEGMSLTAISALMEYEEAILVLQIENDGLKTELQQTQIRLGNVENRLHEVEATIENNSKALVKYESRAVVLIEKSEKK
ncbi:MAG TPA: MerR family transcriptional regulator [Acidimicrobiia bacterium]|jgi:MerR family transcriptional regulator/heat shock protein HspR|nr:MerR family transcriptional regulator [Acidimicrobiia bacterium]